jgi:hypothetical protein
VTLWFDFPGSTNDVLSDYAKTNPQEVSDMRNYGFIAFCVAAAFLAIVYVGGVVPVRGAPVFYHIDNKLNTTAFMGTYFKVMSLFRRRERTQQEDKDMWTKSYQDFDKVLKNTVE